MKIHKNTVIIGILLGIFAVMSIAYSALTNVIVINGTTNITSTWCVSFTNVSVLKSDTASTTYTQELVANPNDDCSDGSVNFYFTAEFVNPGDYVTYELSITNSGSIAAKVGSLVPSEPNVIDVGGIEFIVEGIAKDDIIDAGKTKTITLTAQWNNNGSTIPDITSKEFNLQLNFVQV